MDTPGTHVTRDYREGIGHLADLTFNVIDTSGLEPQAASGSMLGRAAALTADVLKRADAALLLLDARWGTGRGLEACPGMHAHPQIRSDEAHAAVVLPQAGGRICAGRPADCMHLRLSRRAPQWRAHGASPRLAIAAPHIRAHGASPRPGPVCREGLAAADHELAAWLRRILPRTYPLYLLPNKAESAAAQRGMQVTRAASPRILTTTSRVPGQLLPGFSQQGPWVGQADLGQARSLSLWQPWFPAGAAGRGVEHGSAGAGRGGHLRNHRGGHGECGCPAAARMGCATGQSYGHGE